MNTERKEIVAFSGTTILVVMILLGDLLVFGFGLWWHAMATFRLELAHHVAYTEAVKRVHDLKLEVMAREGVPAWADTAYAKAHPGSILEEVPAAAEIIETPER